MSKSGEPFGPRSRASHRARILGLGLSASIAFALAGCHKEQQLVSTTGVSHAYWLECVPQKGDPHKCVMPTKTQAFKTDWTKGYERGLDGREVAVKCSRFDRPISCAELDRLEPMARDKD